MTISLPDEMLKKLEARAKAAGYDRIDDFAAALIGGVPVGSQDWVDAHRSELLALAEQGLLSSPIENPELFFTELVRRAASGEALAELVP